jgi:hypothetical protein
MQANASATQDRFAAFISPTQTRAPTDRTASARLHPPLHITLVPFRRNSDACQFRRTNAHQRRPSSTGTASAASTHPSKIKSVPLRNAHMIFDACTPRPSWRQMRRAYNYSI